MTYGDVEAFLAILRNGSITAAAEALFITQPALSRKLKSLEQELGVRLFEREQGRHYLTLTAKGQEFCPLAEKWMSYTGRPSTINPLATPKPLLKIGAVDSIHPGSSHPSSKPSCGCIPRGAPVLDAGA